MNHSEPNDSSSAQRRQLFTLCRFLSVRLSYRFMLLLLSATGFILTALGRTQFTPYGIALICLILPSFLCDAVKQKQEKESNDIPLSALYKRYHYSPAMYSSYRITLTLCALLLLIWHTVQTTPFTVWNLPAPLVYLALLLILPLILARLLFFLFHHRLMSGRM